MLNHTTTPTGLIKKLSVAVVVANRATTSEGGETTTVEVSAAELEKLNLLVRDAIGYDLDRGDRVTVVSADFQSQLGFDEDVSAPGFWEQPWFANLVRQSFAGFAVLLIVFAVLRPGMRSLMQSSASASDARAALADGSAVDSVTGEVLHPAIAALGGPQMAAPQLAGRMGFEEKMTEVRSVVNENPERVAQVMKKWVSEENGKS